MKAEYVMAFIPRRMAEIGAGKNYVIDYIDVVVKSGETRKIDGANMYFFLVEGFSDKVRITSDSGVYDVADENINEQKHDHNGQITIENRSSEITHLEFIVAIVKNPKN